MELKCFESTDSNGTEQYLIPLEDGSFIAVPKERIEHRQNGAIHGCVDKLDLIEAPSIELEPKRGEWMPIIEANEFGEVYQAGIYCSECGETLGCEANFCPNCGADMRERKESE